VKLHFSPFSPQKKIRFMDYTYTMNPSNKMFTIYSFLIFLAFLFLNSISLKYHYTFSLYKITNFTTKEFLRSSKRTFCRYQPPWFTRHHLLLSQLLATMTYPGITCYYQSLSLFISSHQTP
jgi:hypothetical protein